MASQKKMKSAKMPTGFIVIIAHTPRNAESFSSLSRMLRKEVHLAKQVGRLDEAVSSLSIKNHLQGCLPGPYKLMEMGRHYWWTHIADPAQSDRWNTNHQLRISRRLQSQAKNALLTCVFHQGLRNRLSIHNFYQLLQKQRHVRFYRSSCTTNK